MKKIMFNDRYGLTQAVLEGKKTMTRRICTMTLHRKMKDGHKERFTLAEFLVAKKAHKHVIQIDCYKEGEEIKED